jgi:hypothetical protein
MDKKEKVRENLLRRMADRQGLKLMKSRRRDPNACDFGTYQLVDARTGFLQFADWHSPTNQFGLDLDDIEGYLTEPEQEPVPQPQGVRRKGKK